MFCLALRKTKCKGVRALGARRFSPFDFVEFLLARQNSNKLGSALASIVIFNI